MKCYTATLLICIILTTSCNNSPNNEQAAIQQVLNKQVEGWNNGSIDDYMKGYWNNDSLCFIGSSGPEWGYQNTLERYKLSYPDKATMGTLSFEDVKYNQLSIIYYHVSGKFFLDRDSNDASGYFTLLFKRIDGEWKIVYDHSS